MTAMPGFAPVGCLGKLTIDKVLKKDCCNPEGMYLPGDIVTWELTVANNTAVAVTALKVEDKVSIPVAVGAIVVTRVLTGAVVGAGTVYPINDTLTLPANSKVVYTIKLTVGAAPLPSCPYSITNSATMSQGAGCDRKAATSVAVPAYLTNNAADVNRGNVFDKTFDWSPRTRDMTALLFALLGGTNRNPLENDCDAIFAELSDAVVNGKRLAITALV